MGRTHWWLALVVAFAGVVAATNIGKVAPVIPLIQGELGLSLGNVGWIVSAFSVCAMFLCLAMSIIASKAGNYRLAVAALLLMGGGGLVSANADAFGLLLIGRVTESLGFVMIAVTGPALIARVVLPEDRALALTFWSLWLPVGVVLMLLLSPLLVGLSGWRLVWSVTAWLSLFWALVLGAAFFHIGRAGDREPSITWPEFRGLFQPDSLLLCLSLASFSCAYMVGTSFAPTYWFEVHDISLKEGAYWLSAAMVGTIVGNLTCGILVKKGYSGRSILLTAFVIPAMLGGLSFVIGLPFWFQYICFFVFTTCTGAVPTAAIALAPTYVSSPAQIGPSVALVFQGATIGQVIGPIIFSQLIEYHEHNWSWGLAFFIAMACIGGGLMSMLRPPGYRRTLAASNPPNSG